MENTNLNDSVSSSDLLIDKIKFSNHSISFDKKKAVEFYEIYKNKILESNQEKFIITYKEKIFKLTELEVLISRLEKYEPVSPDIKENIDLYIQTAKNVKCF